MTDGNVADRGVSLRRALLAARYRAQRAEAKLEVQRWRMGQEAAELRSKLERAEAERDAANATMDELAKQLRCATLISPDNAPSLATYIRDRYARERDQWRANHDQRKAERDDWRAKAEQLAYERDAWERLANAADDIARHEWPGVLARNLHHAAAQCAWWGLEREANDAPHPARFYPGHALDAART